MMWRLLSFRDVLYDDFDDFDDDGGSYDNYEY
jgi:hypothetical protein